MANEKRLIDANDAESGIETTKIKTHYARIVVDGTAERPYYSIVWFDPVKKEYYLGYSSYNIGNVFNWLAECFEIVKAPTVDAVKVVRCKDCKHCDTFYPRKEIGKEPEQVWYCKPYKLTRKPDDFCSDGARDR